MERGEIYTPYPLGGGGVFRGEGTQAVFGSGEGGGEGTGAGVGRGTTSAGSPELCLAQPLNTGGPGRAGGAGRRGGQGEP